MRQLVWLSSLVLVLVLALVYGYRDVVLAQTSSGAVKTIVLQSKVTLPEAAGTTFSPVRSLTLNDVSKFSAATLFSTVDVSGTTVVTVTLQTSADGVSWADHRVAVANNSNGSLAYVTVSEAYAADGTYALPVNTLLAEYVRLKIEKTAGAGNTLVVRMTLR